MLYSIYSVAVVSLKLNTLTDLEPEVSRIMLASKNM